MADIKQDLYGLEYSDSFSLQGIQEAEVNLNLTPAPPPSATITGVVTDGTDPIPNATVKLFDSTGTPFQHTLTDAAGQYTLNDVIPGSYTISAVAEGYLLSAPVGVAVNTGGTAQVNLTCTAEATLSLGAIAGVVTVTGTGVPLAGARVTLTNALREVVATTYTVADGEFVAVMGPSGCGKSTLLNILGLLDSPTSGSYLLDGHEVARLSEMQRNKLRKGFIGFVFQSFNLIDELNVYENIELPLLYMGVPSAERRRRVEEAMKRMSISHRAKHFPQQLSGGQQQRVAIARTVVTRPRLILADEPTGNLDSRHGCEVMDLLSELHRDGTTIVMVTHSQRDAGYADRIVNLFDGRIVTDAQL